jgi:hypothetical protein
MEELHMKQAKKEKKSSFKEIIEAGWAVDESNLIDRLDYLSAENLAYEETFLREFVRLNWSAELSKKIKKILIDVGFKETDAELTEAAMKETFEMSQDVIFDWFYSQARAKIFEKFNK